MGGTGKKSELPNKDDAKSRKPSPAPAEDDDYEDGDFATPKRDRHGDDDQPISRSALPAVAIPVDRAAY